MTAAGPDDLPGGPEQILGAFSGVVGTVDDVAGALGIGGGGLRPCEQQARAASQQASSVGASQARRAWDAVGHETARAILQFPPQSTFCETGQVSIACSGGFDVGAFQAAGGPSLQGPAARVLSVAGVSGMDGEGCSEVIQVAKIVLGKWQPSSDPDRGRVTADVGTVSEAGVAGLPVGALLVGVGLLGTAWIITNQ